MDGGTGWQSTQTSRAHSITYISHNHPYIMDIEQWILILCHLSGKFLAQGCFITQIRAWPIRFLLTCDHHMKFVSHTRPHPVHTCRVIMAFSNVEADVLAAVSVATERLGYQWLSVEQEEANVLHYNLTGRNVFLLLPMGAGHAVSVTLVLPSSCDLLCGCVGSILIVVCPLKSLMEDQVAKASCTNQYWIIHAKFYSARDNAHDYYIIEPGKCLRPFPEEVGHVIELLLKAHSWWRQ